jgi:hypothetical protein
MNAKEKQAFERLTYKAKLFKHMARISFLSFDLIQVYQALI